jgi:hypothetical protein
MQMLWQTLTRKKALNNFSPLKVTHLKLNLNVHPKQDSNCPHNSTGFLYASHCTAKDT